MQDFVGVDELSSLLENVDSWKGSGLEEVLELVVTWQVGSYKGTESLGKGVFGSRLGEGEVFVVGVHTVVLGYDVLIVINDCW